MSAAISRSETAREIAPSSPPRKRGAAPSKNADAGAEPSAPQTGRHGDAALQRADGAARVALGARDGRTVLAGLYQRSPCRVLLPRAASGCEIVLLNTAGGVAGGDRLALDIAAGDGAHATVTSQAAEKIYRAIDSAARIRTSLVVASGAALRWLPQETILFDGARLDRRIEISVAGDGRLVALEWLVLGRVARGEMMRSGAIAESWRVRHDGRLVWADGLGLDGDIAARIVRPALLGGARAMATIVQIGDNAEARLAALRARLNGASVEAGASVVAGMLVCRLLARDPAALRAAVIAALSVLGGGEGGLPRVWTC